MRSIYASQREWAFIVDSNSKTFEIKTGVFGPSYVLAVKVEK